jgi:hypothetical protein
MILALRRCAVAGLNSFSWRAREEKYLSRRDAVTLSEEQEKILVLPRCAKAGQNSFSWRAREEKDGSSD